MIINWVEANGDNHISSSDMFAITPSGMQRLFKMR